MTEARHRNLSVILKWFGLVSVLGGAVWTIVTYFDGRTKERNGYIFERQADLYLEATRASATIALGFGPSPDEKNEIDEKTLRQAEERFEQLYYGDLVVVEDRRVEVAMVAFRDCWQSGGKNCERYKLNQFDKPIKQKVLDDLPEPNLKSLAIELAACTRSALQQDREISFGQVRSAETICPYD